MDHAEVDKIGFRKIHYFKPKKIKQYISLIRKNYQLLLIQTGGVSLLSYITKFYYDFLLPRTILNGKISVPRKITNLHGSNSCNVATYLRKFIMPIFQLSGEFLTPHRCRTLSNYNFLLIWIMPKLMK